MGGLFRSADFSAWMFASTRSSCFCLCWRSATVPDGSTGGAGLRLWLLLLLAVVVREVARAIAAAWYGLELRSILLLPTGGLMTYATPEATERAATPAMQKRMAVVGPIANIGFGLLLPRSSWRSRPRSTSSNGPGFALPSAARRGLDESAAGRGKSAAGLAARRRPRLSRRVREGPRRHQGIARRRRARPGHRHRPDRRRALLPNMWLVMLGPS